MAQQHIDPVKQEDLVEVKELREGWQGVLEHLDIPPGVIAFLEKRKKEAVVCLGFVAVVILAATGWSAYSHSLGQKAASALSDAMSASSDIREEQLQKVVEGYGSSDAAQWARIELAHLAVQSEDFDKAEKLYGQALDGIDHDSPAAPLIRLGLASVYEKKGDIDKALSQYAELAKLNGFAAEGYLGVARMSEQKGDTKSAMEAYEKYLAEASQKSLGGGGGPELKKFVENRLAVLNK